MRRRRMLDVTARRMTVAEARAAGLLDTKPATSRRRTTRETAPRDGAVTVCVDCGARFTTDDDETRHVAATRHARYQLELPL